MEAFIAAKEKCLVYKYCFLFQVQGLADVFILMRYPFESEEAQLLNKQIFETIYYGALESSCELAEKFGPYETY